MTSEITKTKAESSTIATKRAFMRKHERKQLIMQMKNKLPILTKAQIRRYRLPYHEAIIEELEENECNVSAAYMKSLYEYQEKYRRDNMVDIIVMSRPVLIDNNEELTVLRKGLEAAEIYQKAGNVRQCVCEFLETAEHFGLHSDDWLWLADQLFRQALMVSNEYTEDGGFSKAISCYVYGKHLFHKHQETEESLDLLNIARELSLGTQWTTFLLYKIYTKPLFVDICTILYEILKKISKESIRTDPQLALKLCLIAKQRAIEACIPLADVYFLQGKCDLEGEVFGRAIHCFKKARLLYKSNQDNEGLCEARIQLALTYLAVDDWQKCYQELKETLEFAEKNNMQKYVGISHLYAGQYYLNQGMPDKATPDLLKAIEIFHQLNDVINREFVSNLAAVSSGQTIISKYIHLILKCEYADPKEANARFLDLIAWKDSRKPFWETEDEDSLKTPSDESVAVETVSYETVTDPNYDSAELGESSTENEITGSSLMQ